MTESLLLPPPTWNPEEPPGLNWSKDKDDLLETYQALYAQVLQGGMLRFAAWLETNNNLLEALDANLRNGGWEAPPLLEAALRNRVILEHPSRDNLAHLRLIQALFTNAGPRLANHIRYRLQHDGNVHLQFTGPTGMGKSSCAIALADWMHPIVPEQLVGHVSFDLGELPSKLKDKTRGQTVIQDEYVALAGEGSRTLQSLFQNLEDTLRASGVSLFVCSPGGQDHATMQAELELIQWSPTRKASLFLLWADGQPLGVVALPWMRAELWNAYRPWKNDNVQRSLRGQFKDNTYLAKQALALTSDKRFVEFMVQAVNKPKLKDFRSAIELFPGSMISGAQADRLASFMHEVTYNFERLGQTFEEWFQVKPNAGLAKIAAKCYEE